MTALHHIAQEYIAHVKQGRFMELFDSLYATDAVSVEAVAMPGMDRTTAGLDAMRGKSQGFDASHEVHSQEISGLWLHGDDRFAVRMRFEMTHIESGHRRAVDEIAVLTVRDGKITREEFFGAE